MKKSLIALLVSVISLAFVAPMQVSAATSAGVKPGSFFYFFDTASENVGLFFTFDPEKKAQKALEHADERLAEIESIAEEKDSGAIKKAITNYESNVFLATEKSKEVKDKGQAESLLTSIEDSTSRNQEVLLAVLTKVPEEARDAIMQAIEASRRGNEEATRQITELKKEVSELKQELENLKEELKNKEEEPKVGGDKKDDQAIDKLKNEIESLKKKVDEPKQQETKVENKKEESKNSIVNLPNGAVVEMDVSGNIVRTIKEAPRKTETSVNPVTPTPTTNTTQKSDISISIDAQSIGETTYKISWTTSEPSESKIYLSGGGLTSQVYDSQSGFSATHTSTLAGLQPKTNYSYQITAIGESGFVKYTGGFLTDTPKPTLTLKANGGVSPVYTVGIFEDRYETLQPAKSTISWESKYADECIGLDDLTNVNSLSGSEAFLYESEISKTYTVSCKNKSGNVQKSIEVRAIDFRPKFVILLNGGVSDSITINTGESVNLEWKININLENDMVCTLHPNQFERIVYYERKSFTLSPQDTTSYKLECTGRSSGVSFSKNFIVNVQ